MLRALFIGIFFFTITPILICAQWLLENSICPDGASSHQITIACCALCCASTFA